MNPNLKWKGLFILAVIVFCLYFLFGFPTFPTSFAQVKDNFKNQIKLGLDLQGGSQLILEVQVQEAVAQETDTTVDRLSTTLREKNVHYDEIRRVDDTHILIRNIDPSQYSVLSDLVSTQYNNVWDIAPAAGEANSYTLTLRPGAVAAIQEQTDTQATETIEQRINALGLTEPTVRPRGGSTTNQILVQLPGVSDLAEARAVIQAGGQLEFRLVNDPQTYPSVAAYMAQHTVLPAGDELVLACADNRAVAANAGDTYYVLNRAPIITGRDLRSATESRNTTNPGTWQVNFTLSPEAERS